MKARAKASISDNQLYVCKHCGFVRNSDNEIIREVTYGSVWYEVKVLKVAARTCPYCNEKQNGSLVVKS